MILNKTPAPSTPYSPQQVAMYLQALQTTYLCCASSIVTKTFEVKAIYIYISRATTPIHSVALSFSLGIQDQGNK